MHFFSTLTLTLLAGASTAAAMPTWLRIRDTSSPQSRNVTLGPNVTFTKFYFSDPSSANPVITIPISSSVYDLSFTNYQRVSSPAPEYLQAALLYTQRLMKDRTITSTFNQQTSITIPTIDVITSGFRFTLNNPSNAIKYILFDDVLSFVSYFALTWNKQQADFQLINRATKQVDYSGSFTPYATR